MEKVVRFVVSCVVALLGLPAKAIGYVIDGMNKVEDGLLWMRERVTDGLWWLCDKHMSVLNWSREKAATFRKWVAVHVVYNLWLRHAKKTDAAVGKYQAAMEKLRDKHRAELERLVKARSEKVAKAIEKKNAALLKAKAKRDGYSNLYQKLGD